MTKIAESKNAMLRLVFFLFLLMGSDLRAQGATTFSEDRLEAFYDEFLCEEKNTTATVGITGPCMETPPSPFNPPFPPGPPVPPTPPVNPVQPINQKGYFPVVISNQSGIPDTDIYVFATSPPSFIYALSGKFPGQMAANSVTMSTFTPLYSYTLSQFPQSTTGSMTGNHDYLLYIPNGVVSLRIYLAVENPMYMFVSSVSSGLTLNLPASFKFNDPNFNVLYDFGELTLTNIPHNQPNIPSQPFMDTTQVDNLGLSMQLGVYTFDTSMPNAAPVPLIQPGILTTNLAGFTQGRDALIATLLAGLLPAPSWGQLAVPFYTDPYTPGVPLTYLRVLAPKISGQTNFPQPISNYVIPTFPSTYLTTFTVNYLTTDLFPYYAGPPFLYIQADTGSGQTYKGVASGSTFTFTSTTNPANVITIAQSDMTVANMFSGAIPVTGMAPPNDQVAISAYFSTAFVVGLLGVATVFDSSMVPLNQANLRLHNPPPTTMPPYYNPTFVGGPWYDLYAQLLHNNAIVPTNPPYSVPLPTLGLCYAFDYDDKLAISSSVTPNAATPTNDNIYALYTINSILTKPTGVFDDPASYDLYLNPLPSGYMFQYRQGTSGGWTTFVPMTTLTAVTSTKASPFQVLYTNTGTSASVIITLFPKYQFALPVNQYGQNEQNVIAGILFTPDNPAAPTTFTLTMPASP